MSLFPVNRIFIRFHQIWREAGARLRNREWLFVFLILFARSHYHVFQNSGYCRRFAFLYSSTTFG